MYALRMPIGAPPQLAANYDGDQRTPEEEAGIP